MREGYENNLAVIRTGEVAILTPTVPQTFHQLGILINDGSGSMQGIAQEGLSKADCVNMATREMFTRFQASSQRKNFSFAIVNFDGYARLQLPITPASDIDDNANYDPRQGPGSDTFIGAGLLKAREIAEQFLATPSRDVPTSVVMVVLSDGRDREASAQGATETLRIADEIKRNSSITLCTSTLPNGA